MLEEQHTPRADERGSRLMGLANEENCYLTTFQRDQGSAHEVIMWFAVEGETIYLLADNEGQTDWASNILSNPEVSIRIADATFAGMARVIVNHPREEQEARQLMLEKYSGKRAESDLQKWASDALPVAVNLQP